jgi:hypothetical protein
MKLVSINYFIPQVCNPLILYCVAIPLVGEGITVYSRAQSRMSSEPVFVGLFRSPGIDSEPDGIDSCVPLTFTTTGSMLFLKSSELRPPTRHPHASVSPTPFGSVGGGGARSIWGIDSLPGGSIPRNGLPGSINVYKYGLSIALNDYQAIFMEDRFV